MWFERFVIIVTSLHRDFLPSSWGILPPTIWDFATLIGSFGLFFTLFCLFVRFLPVVATAEVKTVLPAGRPASTAPAAHAAPPWSAAAPVERTDGLLRPALPPEASASGCSPSSHSPAALYHACETVRDAGYTRWDAHSPFPVHGLDRAMGLSRSKLPWITLVLGARRRARRLRAADLGRTRSPTRW